MIFINVFKTDYVQIAITQVSIDVSPSPTCTALLPQVLVDGDSLSDELRDAVLQQARGPALRTVRTQRKTPFRRSVLVTTTALSRLQMTSAKHCAIRVDAEMKPIFMSCETGWNVVLPHLIGRFLEVHLRCSRAHPVSRRMRQLTYALLNYGSIFVPTIYYISLTSMWKSKCIWL
jgi:hypothetical protein